MGGAPLDTGDEKARVRRGASTAQEGKMAPRRAGLVLESQLRATG